MRRRFVNALLDATAGRDDFMIISGDAGLGVFDDLRQQRPEAFLNLGIAEQNMASFGAGLALSGYKVVLYNIAPFVLYRCYEQVRNSICYMELPVVLVGTGCGLAYAPAGMTHYAVEDLGVARTIPGLTTLSPCDPMEARAAAAYALEADHPVYVRLAKTGEPELHAAPPADIRRPQVLRPGRDVGLVVHGPIAVEALKAAELLAEQHIDARVVSVPMVQPLDPAALAEALAGVRGVVSVEEQFCNCGLGSRLLMLAGQGLLPLPVRVLAIPDDGFIHHICTCQSMRTCFGLDAPAIADAARDLLA